MSEQITNFLIDGNNMSLHSLMRNVGHGSNRQDFVGEFLVIVSTVSSKTSVKDQKEVMIMLFSVSGDKSVSNRLDLRKKEASWSANDLSDS